MANEFVARKGLIVSGSGFVTGSLNVSGGITGSLFGTSSFAVTSSYAITSSVGYLAKTVDIIPGTVQTGLTQYTGSFTGSLTGDASTASLALAIPTSAPANPITGSIYFSGNFLYIYTGTGTGYRSASLY